MLVTGVQSVGSKGVNSVQVAAVDATDVARIGETEPQSRHRRLTVRPGEPEPVVFPRTGVPLDKRPVALKHHHALQRYAAYGGERKPEDDEHTAA
jgi:hypothetical protein